MAGARGKQTQVRLEGKALAKRARELLGVKLSLSSVLWEVGIPQQEIALEAEVTQSRVSRILKSPMEARKQGLDASTRVYIGISKMLGVPLSDLQEYRDAFGDRPGINS